MVVTIKLSSFSVIALEKAFNNFKNLINSKTSISVNDSMFSLSNLKYVRLPKKKTVITILKSPHIDKKARNQLATISHNRLIVLKLDNIDSSFDKKDFLKLESLLYNLKNLSIKVKFNKKL